MFGLKPQDKNKIEEEKKFQKETADFKGKFYDIMILLELCNKYDDTYRLIIHERTNYGFNAKFYLVPPLCWADIQKYIHVIQENLCCLWIMKTEQFKNYATVKIVTKPLDPKLPYQNPKIKPWELYMALDFSLSVITNDMTQKCMVLCGGATGSGKTRFLYMVLTAWIQSCAVNEVELFIGDIAKNEFPQFKWVKHVRAYANKLNELYLMLQYIMGRLEKRVNQLSKYREANQGNSLHEVNIKVGKTVFSYIHVIIDEFSVILPDKSDNAEDKKMKEVCMDILKKLAKLGRSLSIFLHIGVQKTVKDEIPSIIKSNCAVRISFRANDKISSEVIMEDQSAYGLADRYGVYSKDGGGTKDYLFSPNYDTDKMDALLAPYIDRSRRKLDLEMEVKAMKQPPQPPGKVKDLKKPKPNKKQHHALIDTKGGEFIDY